MMFAVDSAMTLYAGQLHGPGVAEEIQFNVIRSHQEHLFLPGLEKLGLDAEPDDALRCAKFHAFSNVLGGLPVRYGTDSRGRAWLVYDTPYWIDSPWTPSIAVAAVRPELLFSTMSAWHANNGVMLKNDRLTFVFTHMVTKGDPFDAGFFLESDRPVGADERLVLSFGEPMPGDLVLVKPEFDPDVWPLARQAKAWRNFSTDYVGGRVFWSIRRLGIESAVEIFEYSFRLMLLQNRLKIAGAFGEASASELEAAVASWSGAHRAWGDEVDVSGTGHERVCTVRRSRIHEVSEFAGTDGPLPTEFEAAVGRSWKTVIEYGWPGIKLRVDGAYGTSLPLTFTFSQ